MTVAKSVFIYIITWSYNTSNSLQTSTLHLLKTQMLPSKHVVKHVWWVLQILQGSLICSILIILTIYPSNSAPVAKQFPENLNEIFDHVNTPQDF